MIHNLNPYPAYKQSGVPWLKGVPVDWRMLRGKNVFRVIDVRSETGEEELLTVSSSDGVVPRSSKTVTMFKAESYVGHKLCWSGDLVINSLWAWMQGLGFTRHHGLVSSAYSVYRPRSEYCQYANYFHYTLRSAAYKWELMTRSKGVWLSRLQLSDSAFLDMPILVPQASEQSAIVRFLDHANRRIRRSIRAKQHMIKLLDEQKQAIIHRAVTRGLDQNVRLKPSGVEWLGDVPEHWEVKKLRLMFRYVKGSKAGELTNEYIGRHPGPFPVYSGQTETDGLMGQIDWHEFEFSTPVVFVTTVGARAMSTRLVSGPFSLSQNCALIIPRSDKVNPEFFEYVFQRLFEYEKGSISLIMQPSLRFSDLNKYYVPCPPVSEQVAISGSIRTGADELERVIGRTRNEISLPLAITPRRG